MEIITAVETVATISTRIKVVVFGTISESLF